MNLLFSLVAYEIVVLTKKSIYMLFSIKLINLLLSRPFLSAAALNFVSRSVMTARSLPLSILVSLASDQKKTSIIFLYLVIFLSIVNELCHLFGRGQPYNIKRLQEAQAVLLERAL